MKSNKQKKKEIKYQRALKKDKKDHTIPPGAIMADHAALSHNNTYDPLPLYYTDINFTCVDCGNKSVFTAAQQKWWYEIAKGHIHSRASRCEDCRAKRKAEKEAQKQHMEEMAKKAPHPNETFFKKKKE